eukprot:313550_1
MVGVTVFLILLVSLCNGLSITNITPPINLTQAFFPSLNGQPGSMTYYIDPSDPSQQKYLFFGIFGDYGEGIIADIFTQNFTQYTNINSLPFTISGGGYENPTCTSPKTKDILSCWQSGSYIFCKIYSPATNTWSNEIIIYGTSDPNAAPAIIHDVICFEDSYFIPFAVIQYNYVSSIGLGTLMDLNGNIIYSQVRLNITLDAYAPYQNLFASKGGGNFDVSKVNKYATELIMLYLYDSRGDFTDHISDITMIYAYYTNINDSHFPIYIYNQSVIFYLDDNLDYLYNNINSKSINVSEDCCYVSLFQVYDPNFGSGLYAHFADIYGNYVNITNYTYFFGQNIFMMTVGGLPEFVNNQIIDLSMISNANEHYFMVLFGTDSLEVMAAVYYLKYDESDGNYSLHNNGYFSLTKAQSGYFMDWFLCYMLPEQNLLYCSWNACQLPTPCERPISLFAQTFTIN